MESKIFCFFGNNSLSSSVQKKSFYFTQAGDPFRIAFSLAILFSGFKGSDLGQDFLSKIIIGDSDNNLVSNWVQINMSPNSFFIASSARLFKPDD